MADFLDDDDDDIGADANGDMKIGNSNAQEVYSIMMTNQGNWRNSPLTGLNLLAKSKSNITANELIRAIETQLEADNFIDYKVAIVEGKPVITRAER
ncbi:hypothetical protein SAMN05421780_101537 [Flexibacter flexilis DSM 6793]|uniref:Uncharacterized protein n=1 Tax=Flexibacter flexilis DSM 6793 TaxID=927664 RepID=A0A1I1E026_9BACT|nr:hypothetical protein [Flexibacter flexilis]SFB80026.1 hypothetical protein SAMN05421780_101537 [Flexibacter flexilis DSM 6793]